MKYLAKITYSGGQLLFNVRANSISHAQDKSEWLAHNMRLDNVLCIYMFAPISPLYRDVDLVAIGNGHNVTLCKQAGAN